MATELYYSPYCEACTDPRVRLAAKAHDVTVKDITEHLAEAVGLGIVRPPALVIDGHLVAQGTAAVQRLTVLVKTGQQCAPVR